MTDEVFMARALRLAERGLYTTHPNPRVGCVLVVGDEIVGEGYHRRAGEEHAEAMALRIAGPRARGATAYVTLEPCSFEGRTPACAAALVRAGVTRVVAAMADPHPKNQGAGFAALQKAGIAVTTDLMALSARTLNPGHISKFEQGRPFVRIKLAMTLDGKTALANGVSQWITGPGARSDVQKLRARSSAIVTGVQTVIDDDPALTVRASQLQHEHADLAAALPRPIFVLDSRGRIPPNARVLANPDTVVVTTGPAEVVPGVAVCRLAAESGGRVDLVSLMAELARRDCNEVLFECGATLAGALVREQLIDEVVIYVAPRFMGHQARSLLNLPEIGKMSGLHELEVSDVRMVGSDIRITANPVSSDQA
ncbi:MAG: bifunctional diaminohydroxyphosphoribosylaminopyrimidine deaminase/5-amino-6-(5-phosphoribosylamino)uracil reductase RibD [Proteobacteria bacterium]|nr:bifunctional diaminohydroxyphosphoribosylaminopyrimidine deaminase/5-amino-6-(5-phosphoribosylamino)uracil reductase RibD [Pseudomonadota bacterium]